MDTWVTTAALCDALTQTNPLVRVEGENDQNSLLDALPEWLQVALKEKPKSFKVCLGRALEKRVDACFGAENLHVEKTKMTHGNKTLWRVNRSLVRVGQGSPPLRAEKNSEVQDYPTKNASGMAGKNPTNPDQMASLDADQKTPNGLTGGLATSCE